MRPAHLGACLLNYFRAQFRTHLTSCAPKITKWGTYLRTPKKFRHLCCTKLPNLPNYHITSAQFPAMTMYAMEHGVHDCCKQIAWLPPPTSLSNSRKENDKHSAPPGLQRLIKDFLPLSGFDISRRGRPSSWWARRTDLSFLLCALLFAASSYLFIYVQSFGPTSLW